MEYIITAGRLSQVENSTSLPSLYKLATLCQIYGVSYGELLRIYGVAVDDDDPLPQTTEEDSLTPVQAVGQAGLRVFDPFQ
jgi:transcriptional regulator with XRE-family HTH domain